MEISINLIFQIIGVALFLLQCGAFFWVIKSFFTKPKPIYKITLLNNKERQLYLKQPTRELNKTVAFVSYLPMIGVYSYQSAVEHNHLNQEK